LGPWVRGAGVEPAVPKAPGLRPGAVPRRRPADGDRMRPRGGNARSSIPLLAISSVVKVLLRRDEPSHSCKSARRTRRGAGSRTPSSAGLEAARLPMPRPFACCVVSPATGPEIKRAASLRKRLERSWTSEKSSSCRRKRLLE